MNAQAASSEPTPGLFRAALLGAILMVVPLAGPSWADDVYLANGRVFEEVIATVTETHVVIELAYGRMRLPRAQVARVEDRTTPLETFRARRSELVTDPSSPAVAWAELALWAWAHGLERDATETALLAARLDPRVDGLQSVLVQRGYEQDPDLGWVPRAVAMERRGLVDYRGEWMTPERRSELQVAERAEREAAARAAAARQEDRGAAAEDGPTGNEVALASIGLAREMARELAAGNLGVTLARTSSFSALHPIFIPTLPLSGSGGFWASRNGGGLAPRGGVPTPGAPSSRLASDWEALSNRIPGSRLPLSAFRQPRP